MTPYAYIVLEFASAALCIVLLVGILFQKGSRLPAARWMQGLLASMLAFMLCEAGSWTVSELQCEWAPEAIFVASIMSCCSCIWLAYFLANLTNMLADDDFKINTHAGKAYIASAVLLTFGVLAMSFSDYLFTVDPDAGTFERGEYYMVFFIPTVALTLAGVTQALYVMFRKNSNILKVEFLPAAFITVLSVFGLGVFLITQDMALMIVAMVLIAFTLYAMVLLRQYQDLATQKERLEAQTAQMAAESSHWEQVQKQLNSGLGWTVERLDEIASYCEEDPDTAADAIEALAWDLRKETDLVVL